MKNEIFSLLLGFCLGVISVILLLALLGILNESKKSNDTPIPIEQSAYELLDTEPSVMSGGF